uniref:Crystallin, gamma M7 n=1 Tax=Sphaeramia orbicularis TaxID=375764 RepID=A0A673BEQ8_9TELE
IIIGSIYINFGGRYYECMSDCADLHSMFQRCRSIRVESGMFMIYDRPGYTGNQYFMKRGGYADYMGKAGMNNCVRSCRMIPSHSSTFRIRLYEHFDMGGEMMELTSDCPNLVMERFNVHDIFSCNVTDGNWLFYEHPNYRGRMYLIRPGEYKRFSEWGGRSARVGSIRRIMDY